jgi:hypothetical protein
MLSSVNLLRTNHYVKKKMAALYLRLIKTQNSLKFNFYEKFLNRKALSKHKNRVQISTWLKVTINSDSHFEIKDTD